MILRARTQTWTSTRASIRATGAVGGPALPSACVCRAREGAALGCPRPERALLDRVTLNIRATRFLSLADGSRARYSRRRDIGWTRTSLPPTNIRLYVTSPSTVDRRPSSSVNVRVSLTDGMPILRNCSSSSSIILLCGGFDNAIFFGRRLFRTQRVSFPS